MKAIAAALALALAFPAQAQESPFSESQKSYAIPALEIVGFDFLLNRFNHAYGSDKEDYAVTLKTMELVPAYTGPVLARLTVEPHDWLAQLGFRLSPYSLTPSLIVALT